MSRSTRPLRVLLTLDHLSVLVAVLSMAWRMRWKMHPGKGNRLQHGDVPWQRSRASAWCRWPAWSLSALGGVALLVLGCSEADNGMPTTNIPPASGATTTGTVAVAPAGQPIAIVQSELARRGPMPNDLPFDNPTGFAATVSTAGAVNLTNEFFQDLGTNGRRCVSCHVPSAGWAITPAQVQQVFDATRGGVLDDGVGLGAIFRTNDGANAPTADVATLEARRRAYSQLLSKGLIRVGIGVPEDAEFELVAIDDPYGFASAQGLSLFRRPIPTTNLKFLSAVMWDGRETFAGQTIHFDLADQSSGATTGHAQGNPLSEAQRESIVVFELGLHTAQVWDNEAQFLDDAGAQGGPDAIIDQAFYIGINDLFGDSQTGRPFDPVVFDLYDTWATLPGPGVNEARRRVARGQVLFNTKPITITGVSGINDEPAFGSPAAVVGTCTTCHDSPNAGNHSVVAPLNIGLVDAARRTPDMPLYTLRNKTTGEVVQVTDPGRALISGKWKHIGRFKGPILRVLAPRAPYFHNGLAADLRAVVDFYDDRFKIGLTEDEKRDLVAFLKTL